MQNHSRALLALTLPLLTSACLPALQEDALHEPQSAQNCRDIPLHQPTIVLACLDKSIIQRPIVTSYPRYQCCYRQSMARNPRQNPGKATLRFTIGSDGRVQDARVTIDPELPQDGAFPACLLDVTELLDFPQLRGRTHNPNISGSGGPVHVAYPLRFTPIRRPATL